MNCEGDALAHSLLLGDRLHGNRRRVKLRLIEACDQLAKLSVDDIADAVGDETTLCIRRRLAEDLNHKNYRIETIHLPVQLVNVSHPGEREAIDRASEGV